MPISDESTLQVMPEDDAGDGAMLEVAFQIRGCWW